MNQSEDMDDDQTLPGGQHDINLSAHQRNEMNQFPNPTEPTLSSLMAFQEIRPSSLLNTYLQYTSDQQNPNFHGGPATTRVAMSSPQPPALPPLGNNSTLSAYQVPPPQPLQQALRNYTPRALLPPLSALSFSTCNDAQSSPPPLALSLSTCNNVQQPPAPPALALSLATCNYAQASPPAARNFTHMSPALPSVQQPSPSDSTKLLIKQMDKPNRVVFEVVDSDDDNNDNEFGFNKLDLTLKL
ncbi:hypothetical protein F0562_000510 [Nyssa sinensis]|uniref:Uncharacterized protein n=1 Tax=Nyssa sinensis TaxID=561372 RepID=A0A5J5C1M6_9ASTE|nr:hypothetical protein F0562_000510 [Nyssa sinensis]